MVNPARCHCILAECVAFNLIRCSRSPQDKLDKLLNQFLKPNSKTFKRLDFWKKIVFASAYFSNRFMYIILILIWVLSVWSRRKIFEHGFLDSIHLSGKQIKAWFVYNNLYLYRFLDGIICRFDQMWIMQKNVFGLNKIMKIANGKWKCW